MPSEARPIQQTIREDESPSIKKAAKIPPAGFPKSINVKGKEFLFSQVLGNGAYGIVGLFEDSDGEKVATKLIKPKKKEGKHRGPDPILRAQKALKNESIILQHINSRYVLPLFDYNETDNQLCLNYVENHQELSPTTWQTMSDQKKKDIFFNAALGIQDIHESGVIHRDIKPANILVSENHDNIFIIDFGESALTEDMASKKFDIKGDPFFLPLEVLKQDPEVDSAKIDVYSLGCTMYKLQHEYHYYDAPNEVPFGAENKGFILSSEAASAMVSTANYVVRAEPTDTSSLDNLLWHMIQPDLAERYSMEQVLAHPYFQDATIF